MAKLYLSEDLEPVGVGHTVSIRGAEAHHAVTVSRVVVGQSLAIGNGAGFVASGTVVVASQTELAISVESVSVTEKAAPAIFLTQALAKGERDELAVQAATELGVDGIIPWLAARSISRWEGARAVKGRDRWASVVREASKQSTRAWIPDVLDLVSTKQLTAMAAGARMLVLEPSATLELSSVELGPGTVASVETKRRDLIIVVGPEGGISGQELDELAGAGASLVRLGATVLRTSTAGPAAIAVLNTKLGRW